MGMIGITPLNERPSLGYWLGEPYWRQGLMAEAVRIVVAEFFRKSGCVYLMSGVFVDNAASLALQRKIGFEVVGEEAMECIAR